MGTCIGLDAAQPVSAGVPEALEPRERPIEQAWPSHPLPDVPRAAVSAASPQVPSASPWWGRLPSLSRGSRGGSTPR
jgi:hypothetical protein